MSAPTYLIDTNVFIGLEDHAEVAPDFASLQKLATRHGVGVYVHAAAIDDIKRDNDATRRLVSLSKLAKFQVIAKVIGLDQTALEARYGALRRPNDVVDTTLLHALEIGVADFLGGVDKFEPVSSGGEVDHAEEATGQLVVAGGDGSVDLEVAEHALDAVALLVERAVVLDRHPTV